MSDVIAKSFIHAVATSSSVQNHGRNERLVRRERAPPRHEEM